MATVCAPASDHRVSAPVLPPLSIIPAAGIPAVCPVLVVGHPCRLVGERGDLLVPDRRGLAHRQTGQLAVHPRLGLGRPVPMQRPAQIPDPFAGVEPVDDLDLTGDVLIGQMPDPGRAIPKHGQLRRGLGLQTMGDHRQPSP